MYKVEVEEEDGCDPAVYGCVWLHIQVLEHAFDILRIHFYNKISDTDYVDAKCVEGTEEAIEFNLQLGVALLMLVPGDGPEMQGAALTIFTLLGEDPTDSAPGRVDREENGARGGVVNGDKGR
jgi:hypothetical protein